MARKETNEQIDALEEKIKQLQARKKALINRQKEADRKARTHRLIQIGALMEKYADGEIDLKVLENFLHHNAEIIKSLRK